MKRSNIHLIIAYILLGAGIIGVYFISRFIGLREFPLFTDEAIYVRWAQEGFFDAGKRLLSLGDGKQPFYVWLVTLLMTWVSNPVAAGRLISVLSGFVTMIGLSILAYTIFKSKQIAIITAVCYILYPFAIVQDRLALYDSLLGALYIIGILLQISLARYLDIGSALALANLIGASWLTKSSGLFTLLTAPIALLMVRRSWKKTQLIKWLLLSLLAGVVGWVYSRVIMLSSSFTFIGEKNTIFIYSIKELIGTGIIPVIANNGVLLFSWLFTYLTIPVVAITIGLYILKRISIQLTLPLILWWLLPFGALLVFGKNLFPRYVFFMTLPLLPIVAYSFNELLKNKKNVSIGILALTICYVLFVDSRIYIDFPRSPIPTIDRLQYANTWVAGGGVKEVVRYLTEESIKQPIFVASEGTYGSLATTVMGIYFGQNPAVEYRGFELIQEESMPEWIREKTKNKPTYIFLNKTQEPPSGWPIKEVLKVPKGISRASASLYIVE